MQVDEAMSEPVVSVGPSHTLREAAKRMTKRNVGAAIVIDGDMPGPGIFTERDLMHAISDGQDPDTETVSEHLSTNLTFAARDWPLERAAAAMERGGFRHLVVIDGGETVGIISMRDIVRCWVLNGNEGSAR